MTSSLNSSGAQTLCNVKLSNLFYLLTPYHSSHTRKADTLANRLTDQSQFPGQADPGSLDQLTPVPWIVQVVQSDPEATSTLSAVSV